MYLVHMVLKLSQVFAPECTIGHGEFSMLCPPYPLSVSRDVCLALDSRFEPSFRLLYVTPFDFHHEVYPIGLPAPCPLLTRNVQRPSRVYPIFARPCFRSVYPIHGQKSHRFLREFALPDAFTVGISYSDVITNGPIG